jgi:hypothetical protein
MTIDIEHMSLEELIQLNKQVVRRIRYLHEKKTGAELEQFAVGDRVNFQSNGRAVEGIVVRVNRKSVSVHTEDGHWNIHPKLLTKLPKAEGHSHGEQAWKQGFLRRMGIGSQAN